MTQNHAKPYKEMMINSDKLEVPRSTYQRELVLEEVIDISNHFNECIANEPKVSFRDGRYFVFDGQHTVAARVHRNGGNPLPILCKVYFGLTEEDEARLFAAQTGFSTDLGAGAKIRALAFAKDPIACRFVEATRSAGALLDFSQRRGRCRLACVATAFREFQKVGDDKYKEAISILLEAWDGDPDSLRSETVSAMCRFVDLYEGEYDRKRLIRRCRKYDPLAVYRKGQAMGNSMAGSKTIWECPHGMRMITMFNMYNADGYAYAAMAGTECRCSGRVFRTEYGGGHPWEEFIIGSIFSTS